MEIEIEISEVEDYAAVIHKYSRALADTLPASLINSFRGGNTREKLAKVHAFVKKSVRYKLPTIGRQYSMVILKPMTLLEAKEGNLLSLVLLSAAIFRRLGIEFGYGFGKEEPWPDFRHIWLLAAPGANVEAGYWNFDPTAEKPFMVSSSVTYQKQIYNITSSLKGLKGLKKRKATKCEQDETGAWYCYRKVQGVYERVSGPYRTQKECKDNL